jgi:hypothetical protein
MLTELTKILQHSMIFYYRHCSRISEGIIKPPWNYLLLLLFFELFYAYYTPHRCEHSPVSKFWATGGLLLFGSTLPSRLCIHSWNITWGTTKRKRTFTACNSVIDTASMKNSTEMACIILLNCQLLSILCGVGYDTVL